MDCATAGTTFLSWRAHKAKYTEPLRFHLGFETRSVKARNARLERAQGSLRGLELAARTAYERSLRGRSTTLTHLVPLDTDQSVYTAPSASSPHRLLIEQEWSTLRLDVWIGELGKRDLDEGADAARLRAVGTDALDVRGLTGERLVGRARRARLRSAVLVLVPQVRVSLLQRARARSLPARRPPAHHHARAARQRAAASSAAAPRLRPRRDRPARARRRRPNSSDDRRRRAGRRRRRRRAAASRQRQPQRQSPQTSPLPRRRSRLQAAASMTLSAPRFLAHTHRCRARRQSRHSRRCSRRGFCPWRSSASL